MANQTGRPIAPARKLVAAVMGTIAIFVMALGLGMSNWGVVIFGLILLVLSIGLGMVNGLRRGARAWIAGTAEVKAITPRPGGTATFGRAQIRVLVMVSGLNPVEETIYESKVPVAKWPYQGDTLPIEVDVDNRHRVRIKWSEAEASQIGEDPPPPPPTRSYDDDDPGEDATADELLGDIDPPPWTTRDREWGLGPDEPPPPPPAAGRYDDATVYDDDATVVVHETPAGKIVEGELVGHDAAQRPLPRRAAAAGAAATTGTAESARPAGSRPSPRPRGAATATAEPETTPYTDSWSPPAETPPETPQQRSPHPDETDDDTPPWERRAEPTRTSAAAAPTATAAPQTAPPPTTAPAPSSPPRRAHEDDIDIPLDPDPDPAPESTPAAADAVAEDLVAPPAEAVEEDLVAPPAEAVKEDLAGPPAEPVEEEPEASPANTRFVSNAAHESEVPTEQLPPVSPAPKPLHSSNTVAAAVGAVAAAAVAAVKKRVTKQDEPTTATGPDDPDEPDDLAGEVITAYPSARPGPAGSIHGVGVTILVTDLARSISFYRDTLGFHAIDQGTNGAVLASGDTRLVLRTVRELPPDTAGLMNLNLEVGDVESVYQELRGKGVHFVHPPRPVDRGDRLELWSATFRDPDAHGIAITQWRAIRA